MRQTADKYIFILSIYILYISFFFIQLKCFFHHYFIDKGSVIHHDLRKKKDIQNIICSIWVKKYKCMTFSSWTHIAAKGLSALDFKAFPSITFAFPTALKRHSAVFFPQTLSKYFLLSHSHKSSFSEAPGVFLVVQCFEKGRNNNEQSRINSVVKKGKGCAWAVWDHCNVRALNSQGLQSLFPVSPVITFIPSFPGIPLTLPGKNNTNVQEKEQWSRIIIQTLGDQSSCSKGFVLFMCLPWILRQISCRRCYYKNILTFSTWNLCCTLLISTNNLVKTNRIGLNTLLKMRSGGKALF